MFTQYHCYKKYNVKNNQKFWEYVEKLFGFGKTCFQDTHLLIFLFIRYQNFIIFLYHPLQIKL